MFFNKSTIVDTAFLNWTIDNFKTLPLGEYKFSTFFHSHKNGYRFQLFLNGNSSPFGRNKIMFGLYHKVKFSDSFFQYRVSIVDGNNKKWFTKEFHWHYIANTEFPTFNETGYINRSAITSEMMPNGSLTIYCEIDVVKFEHHLCELNPIMANYLHLLESGEFSDITLKVKEKEFLLHKTILTAQSPTFAEMIKNNVQKEAKVIEIGDVEVETFEELLKYLYAGIYPNMAKYAAKLLKCSDKFQLRELKLICEDFFASKLNIDSAASTLVLANNHNASGLKSKCISFINTYPLQVKQTEGWKTLLENHIELVIELYNDKCKH